MAVAVALWSVALTPGKTESIIPQSDLRITNVALGDELADASGRTSVKFTYNTPIKLSEDDEDDDDVPEPLSTTVLCSLTPGKIEHATVDLILEENEEFVFELVGKNTIYLTGNYIDQTPPDNIPFDEDSDDDDVEEAFDLRDVSSDVEIDADELIVDDEGRFEEVPEEKKTLKRPHDSDAMETDEANLSKAGKKQNKKLKAEDGKAVAAEKPEVKETDKKEKKDKKKKNKKEQGSDEKNQGSGEKNATPAPKDGETKELPSGVKVKDVKTGTGPQAKKGNTVSMRYIGKLQNGKVFDSNTKGKPFTFHLGKGEVIKGWDEGIVGMQVGGERLLVIPSHMAYGNKLMDDIPAKSTLIFECKLVQIK